MAMPPVAETPAPPPVMTPSQPRGRRWRISTWIAARRAAAPTTGKIATTVAALDAVAATPAADPSPPPEAIPAPEPIPVFEPPLAAEPVPIAGCRRSAGSTRRGRRVGARDDSQ